MMNAAKSGKLTKAPSKVLETARAPNAMGEMIYRASSSGGFRPRPELLAAAQAAVAEKQNVERISKRVLEVDAEKPAPTIGEKQKSGVLARAPSGLSGPGMLSKTPTTGASGGFKPKKVDPANAPKPAPPKPAPTAPAAPAEAEYDPMAQFARDAAWFSKSYGTISEAADPARLHQKQQVKAMMKGKSSKLVHEVMDDDETSPPAAPIKAASAKGVGSTAAPPVAAGIDLAEVMRKDAAQRALVQKALAAADERHDIMMAKMGEIEASLAALRKELRGAAPGNGEEKAADKAEDNNPLAGLVKGFSQMFVPKDAATVQ